MTQLYITENISLRVATVVFEFSHYSICLFYVSLVSA